MGKMAEQVETMTMTQLHERQPLLAAGRPLDRAAAAMVLIHGRGATAQGMLSLAAELDNPDFAYLAPQAAGNTWYPLSFLAPIQRNEPALSSALAAVGQVLDTLSRAGIPPERTLLLGFSQGACLALEFAARNPRHYGGIVALSGGLIGPDGTPRNYDGSLNAVPVFLGCSDVDPHIPKERVIHSGDVFRCLGGEVTVRLYPGLGHTVNDDEIVFVRDLMARVAKGEGVPLASPQLVGTE